MFQRVAKRIMDYFLAIVIGILALPVMLVTILVIKIASPEDSPIFKQVRIGYKCRPFHIVKLRTMTNERDAEGNLLPDWQRMKPWGRVIRKLNLA